MNGADYFESAHLIPRSEKNWFGTNDMGIYNANTQLPLSRIVDDPVNAIALRGDIHSAFDDHKFVIVPKQSKWVVQFIGPTNRLGYNYHNTHIRLKGVSAQFLYARFAWSIFTLLTRFLGAYTPRTLLVELPNGQMTSKSFTSEERNAAPVLSRRTSSPRKRRMTDLEEGQSTASPTNRENERGIIQVDGLYTAISPLSASSLGSPPQPSLSRQLWSRQDWLRQDGLIEGRPSNPSLYCCDYSQAESDERAGRPGKVKFGGGYLCDRCLGREYLEDRDKDVEVFSWDDGGIEYLEDRGKDVEMVGMDD